MRVKKTEWLCEPMLELQQKGDGTTRIVLLSKSQKFDEYTTSTAINALNPKITIGKENHEGLTSVCIEREERKRESVQYKVNDPIIKTKQADHGLTGVIITSGDKQITYQEFLNPEISTEAEILSPEGELSGETLVTITFDEWTATPC